MAIHVDEQPIDRLKEEVLLKAKILHGDLSRSRDFYDKYIDVGVVKEAELRLAKAKKESTILYNAQMIEAISAGFHDRSRR